MDYFKKLQEWLRAEREADKASYLALMHSSTVSERRAAGLAWYPVAIRGSEPGRGDYLVVELERTTHKDIPHQLRFGASALFFSNHDPEENSVEGVISYQGGDRLKITLKTEELPDWASDGKLGIDLLFDDNSYDEMQKALTYAATLTSDRKKGRLARVLSGESKPEFEEDDWVEPLAMPSLNPSQAAAVRMILASQDIAIVHGPPGTGKTTTLVHAIQALIARDPQQVLVTAPSNTAVDLLSEKLADAGLRVIRVGNPARVSEHLTELTLDYQLSNHPASKESKKLKRRAAEFRDLAQRYKRNFGPSEREQRKALLEESRKLMKEVDQTERYVLDDLLGKAQVIAATLVGAAHYTIRDRSYRVAFIDEAGQALEPACWIPAVKSDRLVLAGDHCQLPPVIKSGDQARNGLSETLMEKCVARYPETVSMLEEQYRMNRTIMDFPSGTFYEDRLKAHPSVAEHLLFPGDEPLQFIDTAGCGFEERQEGTAICNPEEAAFLLRHLTALVEKLAPIYRNEDFPTIGVISPYRLQVEVLAELLEHSQLLSAYTNKISVNTIDGFQGQERDVIYISMTRNNADSRIGFLSEIRRMNVAMTRARKRLVVIGDSGTLSQSSFYGGFIEFAQNAGGYKSAWEFMD